MTISQLFTLSNLTDNAASIIIILAGLVLGFIISAVYKKTGPYTKNFLTTIAVLPALTSTVLFAVNGNVGTSVAILGVFSLVRFRSVPGTSREIVSIFFSMAVGLLLSTGNIPFALLVTIIISAVLFFFSKSEFGKEVTDKENLKILIPEDLNYNELFDTILEKYTSEFELIKVKTTNMGSMYELSYDIVISDKSKQKEMIDSLRCKNGNLTISVCKATKNSNELL